MPKQVTDYNLRWNPVTNTGAIYVKLDNAPVAEQVPVNSVEEFIAVSLILDKSPVIRLDDGTLDYRS